jgi:hypothetical protein
MRAAAVLGPSRTETHGSPQPVRSAGQAARSDLILTNRTGHLESLTGLLREAGHDPLILRGEWEPRAARRRLAA